MPAMTPPPESGDAPPDADLVARAAAGDADAFEVLYRRHRDWAAGLAFRFTGDHDAALDVMQETFLYFLRKLPTLRLEARLTTFLYPVVKHLARDARAKSEREKMRTAELAERTPNRPGTVTGTGTGTEASLGGLEATVARLSEEHRETLLMRFVDGMTLAEIAQVLEVPLGTVKSRLHAAVTTLRSAPRTRDYFSE